MPIGSDAKFIDANIFDGSAQHPYPAYFHIDQDIFIQVTTSDNSYPWYDQGGWGENTADYCKISGTFFENILFPLNATYTLYGHNNAAAILQPDNITLLQTQPLYRCNESGPILSCKSFNCQKNEPMIPTVSILGNGIIGAHGGTGLSSIGGTIRDFELIGNDNDTETMKHSIKIEMDVLQYYYNASNTSDCYVWPAIKCDADYYNRYGGIDHNFKPGILLAIPSNTKELNITTVPGKKIHNALRYYGGYIVDGTGKTNRGSMCAEWGIEDKFEKYYGYSFDQCKPGQPFYEDLLKIFQALKIVKNNGPDTVGGGGTPLKPLSPPICQ
eukprot:113774_1